jgi:hypothetical protein
MATLQDDNLRSHEEALSDSPVNPMSDEERALFKPFEHDMAAGIEFDPNKRVAAERQSQNSAANSSEGSIDASAHHAEPQGFGSADSFNFSQASAMKSVLQGAGIAGGGLIFAKMALSALNNNKGKAAAGGGIAALVVGLGFFAGSLGLVHLKNNADKKLNGITSTIFDAEFDDTILGERSALKRMFKNLGTDPNVTKLDDALGKKGIKVTANGLEVPPEFGIGPSQALGSTEEITERVAKEAKDTMPVRSIKGARARNKAQKALVKKIGVARNAAIAAALKADEDAKAKVKEEARKGAIEGEEGTSEQLKKAKADAGDAAEAGDEVADELVGDGAKDVADDAEGSAARTLAREGGEEVAQEVAEKTTKGLASAAGGLAKGAIVGVLQMTCRLGGSARTVYVAGLIAKKVNLMKVFGVFANNADAMVTGQVNTDMLNEFMNVVWNDESSGKSLTSASGLGMILGSGSTPDGGALSFFRTDRQNVGGFMGFVITLFSIGAVKTFCNGANSTAGTIGLTVAEWAIPAIAGALTAPAGGSGGVAVAATEQAVAQGVKQSVVKTIGKAVVEMAAKAASTEVGAQLAERWMKSYVQTVFSSTMVTFSKGEAGPFMGNAFSAGAGAFYEQSGRNSGMQPLTRIAYNDAMKDVRAKQRTELAQKSLYQRFASLNYADADSLVAQSLAGSPIASRSPRNIAVNLAQAFTNMGTLSQTQKFASTALSGSAFAQSQADGTKLDANGYVTDGWGNYIVGNNFSNVDMFANYDTLQGSGEIDENGEPVAGSGLEKYINNCTDIDIKVDDASNDIKSECSSSTRQASLEAVPTGAHSYQAYLMFRDTVATLDAVYNPVVESEFVGPEIHTGETPTGTVTADQTATTQGCGGIQVHKSIVDQLERLCAAAAPTIALTGGGWRDPQEQIALRKAHCGTSDYDIYQKPSGQCSPPTARPGTSNHERGLAIDFRNCSNRSTACYKWLAANAATYGFKNLPSEAWHWSVDGG